jgi:hypothetical protein
VKIGTKVVAHGHYHTLQRAEVAVPRELFWGILGRIAGSARRPGPMPTKKDSRLTRRRADVRPGYVRRPPARGRSSLRVSRQQASDVEEATTGERSLARAARPGLHRRHEAG